MGIGEYSYYSHDEIEIWILRLIISSDSAYKRIIHTQERMKAVESLIKKDMLNVNGLHTSIGGLMMIGYFYVTKKGHDYLTIVEDWNEL